ncbi:MAG: hypothetical protein FWF60_03475, partial [Oscillospiraceae bacterium]|nr:hypothetical protein [Oscillospiraceae bacterium]
MEHTLLPRPNGRTDFTGESLPLPRALCVDRADFTPEPLEAFAQRAGVALADGGPPLVKLYRNKGFPA